MPHLLVLEYSDMQQYYQHSISHADMINLIEELVHAISLSTSSNISKIIVHDKYMKPWYEALLSQSLSSSIVKHDHHQQREYIVVYNTAKLLKTCQGCYKYIMLNKLLILDKIIDRLLVAVIEALNKPNEHEQENDDNANLMIRREVLNAITSTMIYSIDNYSDIDNGNNCMNIIVEYIEKLILVIPYDILDIVLYNTCTSNSSNNNNKIKTNKNNSYNIDLLSSNVPHDVLARLLYCTLVTVHDIVLPSMVDNSSDISDGNLVTYITIVISLLGAHVNQLQKQERKQTDQEEQVTMVDSKIDQLVLDIVLKLIQVNSNNSNSLLLVPYQQYTDLMAIVMKRIRMLSNNNNKELMNKVVLVTIQQVLKCKLMSYQQHQHRVVSNSHNSTSNTIISSQELNTTVQLMNNILGIEEQGTNSFISTIVEEQLVNEQVPILVLDTVYSIYEYMVQQHQQQQQQEAQVLSVLKVMINLLYSLVIFNVKLLVGRSDSSTKSLESFLIKILLNGDAIINDTEELVYSLAAVFIYRKCVNKSRDEEEHVQKQHSSSTGNEADNDSHYFGIPIVTYMTTRMDDNINSLLTEMRPVLSASLFLAIQQEPELVVVKRKLFKWKHVERLYNKWRKHLTTTRKKIESTILMEALMHLLNDQTMQGQIAHNNTILVNNNNNTTMLKLLVPTPQLFRKLMCSFLIEDKQNGNCHWNSIEKYKLATSIVLPIKHMVGNEQWKLEYMDHAFQEHHIVRTGLNALIMSLPTYFVTSTQHKYEQLQITDSKCLQLSTTSFKLVFNLSKHMFTTNVTIQCHV